VHEDCIEVERQAVKMRLMLDVAEVVWSKHQAQRSLQRERRRSIARAPFYLHGA